MTQVYDTGAVFVYAGIGAQGSPVFVGTGERAPKQRNMRGWEPVFNDLAGTVDPFEELYEGQWCFVTVRLTRWNYAVMDVLQSTPFTLGAGGGAGTDALGDVGMAMQLEGALYPLWVLYDYGLGGRFPKLAMIDGAMPPGRRYLGVKLEGPDEVTTGTQANMIDLVWKAKRIYDPTTGNFLLYDANVAGLPAPT